MEIPTIKPQDILTFHKLHSEFKEIFENAGAELTAAQLNGEEEITISRNGKPITIRERDLWDEVFSLGAASDAGEILKHKYPAAFELSAQAETKKAEMSAFSMEKWGIDPVNLALSNIISLIEGVVEMKLKQA